MKGLLLKDAYLLKRNLKGVFLMLILFGFIGWQDPSSQMIISITPIMAMMIMNSFSYDQASHFETYAMTVPIKEKTYVLEKYVLGFLLGVSGSLFSGIILGLKGVVKGGIPLSFMIQGPVLGLFMSVIILGLSLPLFFKFPTSVARTYFLVIVVLISFLGMAFSSKISLSVNWTTGTLILISTLIAILVFGISYVCSLRFFKDKFKGN